MKINYKEYPILKILETGDFSVIKPDMNDFSGYIQLMGYIKKSFKNYLPFFKTINHLSIPFIEASLKSYDKLLDLYIDVSYDKSIDISVNGCWIAGHGVTMIYRKYNESRSKVDTAMFGFSKGGVPLFSFIEDGDIQNGFTGEAFMSDSFAKYNNISNQDRWQWIQNKVIDMVIIQMFKSYADVETKLLPPGQKTNNIYCRYSNQTKLNITFLDSKWYTNLVKSDSFKVSGHFRLQPCGEGSKDRKLIWVNEFQKTGYNSSANISKI